MANYMLVDADKLEGDLKTVADSIRSKAGKTGEMKFPDEFKSVVDGIVLNTGTTAQIKTGTVTGVSGTAKTVDCGFKPDAIFFTGTSPYDNQKHHAGVAFTAGNVTSTKTLFPGSSSSYVLSAFTVTQTSSGFSVNGIRLDTSLKETNESNRSLSYIAIKYT
jgi:hypothetical protein